MTKMNPEIKAKWVAALRSGAYQQGRDQLRSESGFCCLGVLCDLHSKETGAHWDDGAYLGETGDLPQQVYEWAGCATSEGGKVEIAGETTFLASHNDGYRVDARTFAQIADAIEAQL